jgi:hypothetical protein
MQTYVIDANVTPPPGLKLAPRGKGRPATFPFSRMEIGDSFRHPVRSGKSASQVLWDIRKLAKSWSARNGGTAEFDGVAIDDRWVRIWRTK